MRIVDTHVTYLLCPDRVCNKFWQKGCTIPCESDCPKQTELRKMIICGQCGKIIVLPGDHHSSQRVDCLCGASSFARMSGSYHWIYEMPEGV